MHSLRPAHGWLPAGRVLVGVVTVSLLLSGCGGAAGNADAVDAAKIVDGYDCLAPNLRDWVLPADPTSTSDPEHPDAPEAGRVPAGFIPTTAVRCDLMASIDDDEGRWSGVAAVTLTGDLAPLLAALAEPDDGRSLGPCTADMELVPPLWLVDATGGAINVHYPHNGCGKTKPGVRDALAKLAVRESTTSKRTLIESRAALDSGCASEWTAPFDEGAMLSIPSIGSFSSIDPASPIPSAPLTATATTEVDGMRWCRYSVEPDLSGAPESSEAAAVPGSIALRTGHLVAGGTLDTAIAQLVAGVAASESIPHSCDASAAMFLVLWPKRGREELGMTFTAELDGCQLLYRDRGSARPLPADVLERLTAQAAIEK